jgi:putative ABC transport system ATP-binding protein
MNPAAIPLLRATGVAKTYGSGPLAAHVLRGIDVVLPRGELVLFMGPSGSGKTTLLSILAGLLRPTAGRVELCGALISEMSQAEVTKARRHKLGFVLQNDHLFPALTALDNVAEILAMKGAPLAQAREDARAALKLVGLENRTSYLPAALSGGQKQRVAIARALAGRPALILGDEVTAALDGATANGMMEIFRTAVNADLGVILVTHDHRLERFADRVITLEDGKITCDRRR